MTRLSAAAARSLALVPDTHAIPPIVVDMPTMRLLQARGLVTETNAGWFQRTPFGRETAERLARRAK